MTERLTPLKVCERLIGPVPLIAEICGLSATAPHHWKRGSRLHRPGDVPSARLMQKLLAHSDARGLGLQPRWLIEGAIADEVEHVLRVRETPARFIRGAA